MSSIGPVTIVVMNIISDDLVCNAFKVGAVRKGTHGIWSAACSRYASLLWFALQFVGDVFVNHGIAANKISSKICRRGLSTDYEAIQPVREDYYHTEEEFDKSLMRSLCVVQFRSDLTTNSVVPFDTLVCCLSHLAHCQGNVLRMRDSPTVGMTR